MECSLDTKVEAMESKLDKMERQLDKIESKLVKMENTESSLRDLNTKQAVKLKIQTMANTALVCVALYLLRPSQ